MEPRPNQLRYQPLTALFALLLFLHVAIPGRVGFVKSQGDVNLIPQNLEKQYPEAQIVLQAAGTPTSSSTPQPTSILQTAFPPQVTMTATKTPVVRLALSGQPILLAFVEAPPGPIDDPYVILTAYRSVPAAQSPEIKGTINNNQFICTKTPCALPIQGTARITFLAYNQYGESSESVQATVRAEQRVDGYYITIDTLSQFFTFSDACAGMWEIDAELSGTPWAVFPQNPRLLNTDKRLHLLAGHLITSEIVDARSCPGGGMNNGAPNACGLERANETMINWQNEYDLNLWLTAKEMRVPPRILKTLIEIESQFWPSNERSYLDEFGLGQISQLGIDVLLRQNPSLYYQICPAILTDCRVPYAALTPSLQAMVRGALLNSLNAECPTCAYGMDLGIAKQSIILIALLLRANCQQTDQILDEYGETASYEDYWKFTLVSYHGGIACLDDAVKKVSDSGENMDWKHVSRKLDCKADSYVNRFWDSLSTFDNYLLKPGETTWTLGIPTFLPTPTPLPTIGPPPSSAQVWVIVILDTNNNGIAEPTEWINGIPVTLTFPNGEILSKTTGNGTAIFDLTGYATGAKIVITLPTLYRTDTIRLPENGVLPVVFVFQSVVPPVLP